MKRMTLLSLIAAMACSCGSGDWDRSGAGITVHSPECEVRITMYTPSMARVEKYGKGAEPKADAGFCVTMQPQKVRFKVQQEGREIHLASREMEIIVSADDASVRYMRADGKHLLEEIPGSFSPLSQSFRLEDGEAIYGLGQHREGGLNVRGHHYRLVNENMEIAIPLVHSAKGYALFWNNGAITDFSDSEQGMCFRSDVGTETDYFFVYGGSADGVIAGLRQLSGHVPMFPLWTFGFNQSRERYASQDETVGIVRWFRQNNVPLDCVVQDWQYWSEDNRHWNAVEFGNPRFPDPKKMLDDIHAMNAHCMISVWPSFGPETNIYRDLENAGCLMPHATYPQEAKVRNYDPFNPEARKIYWDYMRNNIYDLGMDAWWLDATEPEHSPVTEADMEFRTAAGPFKTVRNLYPLPSVGGVYNAQMEYDPSRRPFILTRSAALGVQQYAHCWSGDVECSWHTLAQQIHGALNFSLCGLPYWNSDIGAFYTWQNYPGGNQNPDYRNIYLRWMQFAVFTGMMRSHGCNTPREIFNFGQRGDFHFDAQEKAIRLRYVLIPYIYSTAHDISAADGTLMRALMMDWPQDPVACNCDDEYLFGRSILVAPMVCDGTSRELYLPQGLWADFSSGRRYEAGKHSIEVPMDHIATFVKAGSIIPIGPDVNYTAEKGWDELEIRLYPGADGEFTLYEDAGEGNGYRKGEFSTIHFRWDDAEHSLSIDRRQGKYPGMDAEKRFRIRVMNPLSPGENSGKTEDPQILYSGKALKMVL